MVWEDPEARQHPEGREGRKASEHFLSLRLPLVGPPWLSRRKISSFSERRLSLGDCATLRKCCQSGEGFGGALCGDSETEIDANADRKRSLLNCFGTGRNRVQGGSGGGGHKVTVSERSDRGKGGRR